MDRIRNEKTADKELEEKLDAMYKLGLVKEGYEARMKFLVRLRAIIPHWKKERVFNNLLDLFKALANKNRILILLLIGQGVKCSCEIEKLLNLSQSTVSHHLKVLADVNAITIEKTGKWSLVAINSQSISRDFFIQLLDTIFS